MPWAFPLGHRAFGEPQRAIPTLPTIPDAPGVPQVTWPHGHTVPFGSFSVLYSLF